MITDLQNKYNFRAFISEKELKSIQNKNRNKCDKSKFKLIKLKETTNESKFIIKSHKKEIQLIDNNENSIIIQSINDNNYFDPGGPGGAGALLFCPHVCHAYVCCAAGLPFLCCCCCPGPPPGCCPYCCCWPY